MVSQRDMTDLALDECYVSFGTDRVDSNPYDLDFIIH